MNQSWRPSSRYVYISPPNRPERMYRNDRPVMPGFDLNEPLYIRYGADEFVDGQLASAAIRFKKQSVNRGALSEPEDVLFHEAGAYNGLGAVELRVADIPAVVTGEQGAVSTFFMHHEPLDDNYAHSEIWSDRLPATGDYQEPSRSVKLLFRTQVCERIKTDRIRILAVRSRA